MASFVGPSYRLNARRASAQRSINLMPTPLEADGGKSGWYLESAPGLRTFSEVPEADPYFSYVTLLLKYERSLTFDSNKTRTNTINTSATQPLRDSQARWGAYAQSVPQTYADSNVSATGASFRGTAGASSSFTIEFWYYPISAGRYNSTGNVLRNAIMCATTAYPVTSTNYSNTPELWVSNASSGLMGHSNSGLSTALTQGAWHHIAFCCDMSLGAGTQKQIYVDGTRVYQGPNCGDFNTLYFGNMCYGNLLSDGSAADYCSVGLYDDVRVTSNMTRYTGATLTVPTKTFPTRGP